MSSQYASLKQFGDGLAVQALSPPGSPGSRRSVSRSPPAVDGVGSPPPATTTTTTTAATEEIIKSCMSQHFDSLRDKEEVKHLRRALSESRSGDPESRKLIHENGQMRLEIEALMEAMKEVKHENNELKEELARVRAEEAEVDAVVKKSLAAVEASEKQIQTLLKENAVLKNGSALLTAQHDTQQAQNALKEVQKESTARITTLQSERDILLNQLRTVFSKVKDHSVGISSVLFTMDETLRGFDSEEK